ncbi:MAG TPA: sodium-extruding oxaloacetate decarboxylase subunit alpha [Methylotenera sp.]|nr:sodium-extruding oxaloacetate decarboxylase subunit alpha [Methylotenera sp.]
MSKIHVTEVVLRDGHQCQIATRMRTEDMLPICGKLDAIGFWSLEAWGGATFDACVRYLKEDPWERLKTLRKALPNSQLQMLLRGQNLLGYRHYSDDVVQAFVQKAADNGVDVFRIFDALNDTRNLKVSIEAVKKAGKHAQGTISYTTSPVHDVAHFVGIAKELEAMGSDTIAIKDMASLLTPEMTAKLVKALRENVSLPIQIHSHSTSGLASMNLLRALENGAMMIDTCNSAFSEGASHPTTESMIAALKGTEFDTGLDIAAVQEVSAYFREVRKKYWQFESEYTGVDTRVLVNQVPGGMISNLSNQLKDQGALDRMDAVLAEIPAVRKDLGYIPLVTPTSQIVGTQAVLNVMTGQRYKSITNEVKNYFLGQYGKSPSEVNPEVKKLAIGDATPITCRPADLLAPELAKITSEAERFAKSEEDVLTYAMFPDIGKTYLQERNAGSLTPEVLLDKAAATAGASRFAPTEFKVTLHGETFHINLTGSGHAGEEKRPFYVSIDGIAEEVMVETLNEIEVSGGATSNGGTGKKKAAVAKSGRPRPSHAGHVTTSMPGTIVAVKVKAGDKVTAGDGVLVIEAMKMENEIQASKTGIVVAVHVAKGDAVTPDESLLEIQPE